MEIENQLNQIGLKIYKHESNCKLSNETDILKILWKNKYFTQKLKCLSR